MEDRKTRRHALDLGLPWSVWVESPSAYRSLWSLLSCQSSQWSKEAAQTLGAHIVPIKDSTNFLSGQHMFCPQEIPKWSTKMFQRNTMKHPPLAQKAGCTSFGIQRLLKLTASEASTTPSHRCKRAPAFQLRRHESFFGPGSGARAGG